MKVAKIFQFILVVALCALVDAKRRDKRTLGTIFQWFGYKLVPLSNGDKPSDNYVYPAETKRNPKFNRIRTVMPQFEVIEEVEVTTEMPQATNRIPKRLNELKSTPAPISSTFSQIPWMFSEPPKIFTEPPLIFKEPLSASKEPLPRINQKPLKISEPMMIFKELLMVPSVAPPTFSEPPSTTSESPTTTTEVLTTTTEISSTTLKTTTPEPPTSETQTLTSEIPSTTTEASAELVEVFTEQRSGTQSAPLRIILPDDEMIPTENVPFESPTEATPSPKNFYTTEVSSNLHSIDVRMRQFEPLDNFLPSTLPSAQPPTFVDSQRNNIFEIYRSSDVTNSFFGQQSFPSRKLFPESLMPPRPFGRSSDQKTAVSVPTSRMKMNMNGNLFNFMTFHNI